MLAYSICQRMEQALFFLINRDWTSPQMDWLMAVITNWNVWMPFALCVSILFAIFGDFHVRAALICALACIGIVDYIVNSIKHCVGRPRPYMVLVGVRKVELVHVRPQVFALIKPLKIHYSKLCPEHLRGNSFPSGHTANSCALATVFTLFFRRWGWMFMMTASLVAYSRIYVGVHWPLDVIVAFLIGIGTALILTISIGWLWRHHVAQVFPQLVQTYPHLFSSTTSKSITLSNLNK